MTYFCNFGTPVYLGTVAARNFTLGMHVDHQGTKETLQNYIKGVRSGLRDLVLEFWDPLYILEMV